MSAGTYNFASQYQGDTFFGATFTILIDGTPLSLVGVSILMQVKDKPASESAAQSLMVGSGISITDAVNGVFEVEPFAITQVPGMYHYDIQITDSGGSVRTYVKGTFTV